MRDSTRFSLLYPLAIALFLGAVLGGSYLHDSNRLRAEVQRRVASIESLLQAHAEEDIELMNAALVTIEQADLFSADLERGDREALLERGTPLFRRLHTESEITHFYFTDPEGVCLLRLHKPDRFGDAIDRFTTQEARRTGRPASGLELGPLGTLTIRVVRPQFREGRCVGFLELGHEVTHLLELVRATVDVDLGIFVRKEHLDREGWEEGRAVTGGEGDWDRLAGFVAIGQVPEMIRSDEVLQLALVHPDGTNGSVGFEVGEHSYRMAHLPLIDARGQDLGRYVAIIDITDRRAASARLMWAVALGCVAAGALCSFVFPLGRSRLQRAG